MTIRTYNVLHVSTLLNDTSHMGIRPLIERAEKGRRVTIGFENVL
jgi:hypothetical protein